MSQEPACKKLQRPLQNGISGGDAGNKNTSLANGEHPRVAAAAGRQPVTTLHDTYLYVYPINTIIQLYMMFAECLEGGC